MGWRGIGPALAGAGEGTRLRLHGRVEGGFLVDATGRAPLDPPQEEGAVGRVEGRWEGGRLRVEAAELRPGAPLLPEPRRRLIFGRLAWMERLRAALRARGYAEVDTALLLEAAGTDPWIEPIPARLRPTFNPALRSTAAALHTSPELEMKRLLALGMPAIFQVVHVFRQGDLSPWHEPEFCMAEWYRVGLGARELAEETVEILSGLMALPPPRWLSVEEAFGRPLLDLQEGDALARALGGPPEPFAEAFARRWVEEVEPRLGGQGLVVLTDWPAALGMLARRDPRDPRRAERFEILLHGVELANGFAELTDPDEQRARFEEDRRRRRVLGLPKAPLPERFLGALQAGIPPCAGVALGVDRAAALALGAPDLASVLASTASERGFGD